MCGSLFFNNNNNKICNIYSVQMIFAQKNVKELYMCITIMFIIFKPHQIFSLQSQVVYRFIVIVKVIIIRDNFDFVKYK